MVREQGFTGIVFPSQTHERGTNVAHTLPSVAETAWPRFAARIQLALLARHHQKNAATNLPVQQSEFRVHCGSRAGTGTIDKLSDVVEQGAESQVIHT
jgi:hypothetical protein